MPSRVADPSAGDEANSIVRAATGRDNERELTPGIAVVVVLGATATGKTELAVRLARELRGEVVNADSRYLYRGMDIGTAKPGLDEMRGIPHHLIDVVEPTDAYSLSRFLVDAYRVVEDVAARRCVPVVAGGTPQYLRAFIEGWRAPEVAPDAALRAELEGEQTDVLFQRLVVVDTASAERIGPHNKRRMIRALEVYELTGRPMSELEGSSPPPYRFHLIGLRQPREILYRRIDERVRAMFASGWLDEVRRLRERGATELTPALSAHGYREALAVVEDRMTLEEAVNQTSRMVHRYVRHQETWFRKFSDVDWYDSSVAGFESDAITAGRAFMETAGVSQ